MRRVITWVSAPLAAAVILAGGACTSTFGGQGAATCSGSGNHAFVIVKHLTGASVQRCVNFSGGSVDGLTLMKDSQLKFTTQKFSFGTAICSIDSEPKTYSACFAQSGPNWIDYTFTNGHWASVQTGISEVKVKNCESLGWVYQSPQATPAPPPNPPSC